MEKPPNILIIICDHLTQRAIDGYGIGYKYGSTPNIDKLMQNGLAFSNSYTNYPLCCPSRASFWTGRLPHETKVISNGSLCDHPKVSKDIPTVGSVFSDAGYEAKHFGKRHDNGALRGFKNKLVGIKRVKSPPSWPVGNNTFVDRYTTEKCVKFLKKKHKKPFIAVADLNNPHNICQYIGENKGPHIDIPLPEGVELPPLPDNFEIHDLEKRPKPIQYICCSHRRLSQAAHWNEENYRHYIAAFYYYTKIVDEEVGRIIKTLQSIPEGENTLVVLMADHGDSMTSHRMVTKQVSFYEETTRIPFIFSGNLVTEKNKIIKEPLVSLIDLFPTLCDFAGIKGPSDLLGYSVTPWLTGKKPEQTHEYVVTEWFSEWCFTISPGRMIRTSKFKYTKYLEDGGEELFDLENDPGETKTLIEDPNYTKVLEEHRIILEKHIEDTNDPFYRYKVKADPKWRSHKVGYQYHVGSCAPSDGGK
jgi:choline-sulfatase